jgi:hypothetical protein
MSRTSPVPPNDWACLRLERTHATNRSVDGTLRLGLLAANSGGPHLTAIVEAFEHLHPECEVVLSEVFFPDALGPLRRGEIDAMATRLPIRQPDIVVGRGRIVHPTVSSFAQYFGQPEVTYVSISDMPRLKSGLVWRRRASDPRLREFIRVTRDVLAARRKS